MPYPPELVQLLKKQRYHIVGRHSAVKACKWLHDSLVHNRVCYKEKFYNIKSHRCLQMTPAVLSCLTHCIYCWRVMPEDVGRDWDETFGGPWDGPEEILEGCLQEQRRLLSGYKDQVLSGKMKKEKYKEALNPNMVAISLSGEPTLYPKLGALMDLFKRRGFTVFLVTSGVLPQALERLSTEPSQLYISLTAPDSESHEKINRPLSPKLWQPLMNTLELSKSFHCPVVLRITAIRGLNMDHPEKFSKLVDLTNCSYVEVKAYMHLGFSTNRLTRKHMPDIEEIEEMGEKISKQSGLSIVGKSEESRVVLLSRSGKLPRSIP